MTACKASQPKVLASLAVAGLHLHLHLELRLRCAVLPAALLQERVEEEEEEYDDDLAEDEELQDLGPTVDELIDRGQQEQGRLQELNEMLQKKARMALDLKNKGRPPVNRDLARLDGVTTRYKCVSVRKRGLEARLMARRQHLISGVHKVNTWSQAYGPGKMEAIQQVQQLHSVLRAPCVWGINASVFIHVTGPR